MNNTRKRSSMMVRLVAVLAVTMMFTMCFVGGTFAKYTSSATGTDSTTVAKWDIKVNNDNITASDTFNFNLFNTVKDTDGNTETDMGPNDGTIIAPGTRGSFDIVIKNDSQVNAKYTIDYTVNTRSIPVEFSTNGTDWKTDIDDLDVVSGIDIDMNATETVTVYWRWRFEADNVTVGDNLDTSLGSAASAATLTVAAKVTATQVD